MTRLLLIFLGVCFPYTSLYAQLLPPNQPEQNACNALEICGNTFTTTFSYQGIGTVSDLTNTPCDNGMAAGEANVVWLRLNVVTAGIIVFEISPLNTADDYDFAVLDITNATCSTFTSSNVVRCNFNNNLPPVNNGIVGLNTTATSPFILAGLTGNYLQQINASAGDVYLIMINNFGQGTSGNQLGAGFTIDFTGTTATFNGPTPAMNSIIASCNNASQITLQMNHNILCNTIATNGTDFTVAGGTIASEAGINCTGTNGYTDQIVINFASPLPPGNYNLVAQLGTDANTLVNTCNISLPVAASIPFTVPSYEPPSYEVVVQPGCTEVKIKLNKKVSCSAIAGNGSDFSISGPQSSAIIAAWGAGCDTNNFTDTVTFLLQTPLQTDGTYTISAKTGTDNNTLLDSCGIPQLIGDDITFTINSYDDLIIAMDDTVLCNAQYLQLDAVNNSPLPIQTVSCGLSTTTCSGNFRAAFVGTKDSLSTTNSPFFGGAEDNRTQYLFRASELKEMGLTQGIITTLQWKVTQKFSQQPYSNFTIKMGCTPLSNLTNSFNANPQTVFTAPSYNVTLGWNTFTLTTPFNWDGVSNLIVETCFDNISTSLTDEVAHSVTPFISVFQRSGFGTPGCAMTTQGTIGGLRSLRPKIRFYICEPPTGIAKFTWTPGTLLSDSTIQQPLAYIPAHNTYNVTVIDKYGCAHRDSVVVTLSLRDPHVTPTDTTICFGEKVLLQSMGGIKYEWLASDPSTLSCINCAATIAAPKQTTTYAVIVSDQYDCADTLQSVVTVNQLPLVNILEQDMMVKYGTTIQLNAENAELFSWSPSGLLNNPYLANPSATITAPTTFYVTGIDKNGCRNIDSIKIEVDYADPFFVPTAFSPNGDGKNDIFKIGSLSFQKLNEFRIFNRWGQEVFTTTDPTKGWDGTFKGVPQEPGVYHFIIRIAYPNGKVEVHKGDVTLIR
ncbi:MAG TPA: gliding motility-associated C-terminal domain-containing protein [Flavipsychrobacter sp.]|nr:gliding motility-associated C-terminal domain-containing protein [Flavipsychrobacter sp.]